MVTDAMLEHLGFYLRFLRGAAARGFPIGTISVRLTDTELVRELARQAGVDLTETRLPKATAALADAGLPRDLPDARAAITATGCDQRIATRLQHAEDRIMAPLRARWPDVAVSFDLSRLRQATYYDPLCFHVDVDGFPWGNTAIADGGLTDWTARLLHNRKHRLFTSGIGAELIARYLPK
jgi:hypothetical protein